MRSYAQMSSTSSRVASANDEMLVRPSSAVIARLLASTIGTHVNNREQRPDRHCLFLVDVNLVEDPRRGGRRDVGGGAARGGGEIDDRGPARPRDRRRNRRLVEGYE